MRTFFRSKKFSYVLLSGAIIIGSAVFCSRVFSYNNIVTHPALTENVAKVYNANFDRKLTGQEIEWIKKGSIDEDFTFRPINHFFDPNTGAGMAGAANAKNWAQSSLLQKISMTGDYSWGAAISAFAKGDEEKAFIVLGHVLHLLEDMAVPAHTRLDEHLTQGDSYEGWAVGQANTGHKTNPTVVSQLNDAFYNLALYSSRYFLSQDSIEINLANKEETIDKKIFLVAEDDFGIKYKLAEKVEINGKSSYVLSDSVHSDYFNLLAPKAVSYGAGVIKLFFDEAEKKKREEESKSWWQRLKERASGFLTDLSGSLYAGISTSEVAPSPAAQQAEASPAERDKAPEAGSSYSLPANTVVAREKIMVQLPPNTVEAQEKLGGNIVEETNPRDKKIPSTITEEINPSQVSLPSASPIVTASPAPSFLPGGGGSLPSPSPTPDTTPPETTIINSPPATEATTTAIFEFTSSENDSTFSCQLDSATSTSCILSKEYTGLSEGNHTFKVVAIDAIGNVDATPAEYAWTVNLAPEVSISLSDYSMLNIGFTVNWTSSSSDMASYDAQYKIGPSGAWADWAMATTTLSKSFEASHDNTIYYFRVRAVDNAGNVGQWQEIQAPISLKPVIFNEIMYNPNPGSDDYYEYIELYNRSPVAIDLNGWQFVAGGSNHVISADTIHSGSSTSVASGGYALLVDKVTSTTTDSVYDGYYSVPAYGDNALRLRVSDATLNLSNTDTALILKNASSTAIDEVTYALGWGEQDNGKSLERINYNNIYSQNQAAWSVSVDGGTPNSPNSVLNVLAGTPVANSVAILRNTIWTKAGSPYLLYSNSGAYPTLNAGVKLIIEPGATLKPQNKNYYALYIRGTLKAGGNASEKILFTSKEVSPQAGDWGTGIYFTSDSVGSALSFVDFEYGGYQSVWPNLAQPAVIVSGAKVNFDNCVFSNSQTRALDLMNSDSTVQNSQFSNSTSVALYISGASAPSLAGNTFQNSGQVGIAVKMDNGASPSLQSNTITGFDYAVWLQSAYPSFSGNSLSNNSHNGVYVDHHTIISQNTTWQSGLTWLLMSNSGQYPTVATGTTLTLESGVVIKPLSYSNSALKVEGSLMADGNSSSTLISFTSFKDDSLGGDSNNDGNLTSATSTVGDWKNIWLATGSQSVLKFVRFQFGGFNSGGGICWRVKEESLKIDAGAQVLMEEIGVE